MTTNLTTGFIADGMYNHRWREDRNKRSPLSFNIIDCSVLMTLHLVELHKEVVKWLIPRYYNSKHEEASNRWRRSERCSWILETETFQRWHSDGGFLWIYGIRVY